MASVYDQIHASLIIFPPAAVYVKGKIASVMLLIKLNLDSEHGKHICETSAC